jgi:iron complex outermembrane receptor protein
MRNAALASAISTVLALALANAQANAQSADQNSTPTAGGSPETESLEEVVVSGFRESLQAGLELKREAVGVRDSIVAEDIGKFPEMNVAESLQRIPGVFMSRDGASNEGQRIFLRGLGSQYTVTTINGAPVRTTSGLLGNVGSSTRDFNYDVFPSELFGRVDVYKTPLANLEEGGIAGNVDLQTPRPFDSEARIIRYGVSGNYNDQSGETTPRASLLLSDTWGNFGALLGVAYAENINERSGFQSTGGYNSSVISARPAGRNGPFQFALNLDGPGANFGTHTRDEIANAYLPRFYRVYASNNDRQRIGATTSLQYKTERLDISLDGIFSRLDDQADEFTWGVPVRNSRTVAGTTSPPGSGTNSGLIPLDVHIDEYNNLYGTFGNTSFLGESFYRDSNTKFNYGILRGSFAFTEDLKLSAQLNASESKAWYSENRIVFNLFGVQSTFDPTGNVNYPTITTPADIMNPALYSSPTNGFFLNRETDKEETARVQLDWNIGSFAGIEWSTLFGGSRVSTTKQVQRQDGSAAGRAHALPGGGTFSSLGNGVYTAYMDPFMPLGRLENDGNAGYPTTFPSFSRSFVMNDMDANGGNKSAPILFNGAYSAEEVVTVGFLELKGETEIAGHGLRGNVGVRYADTKTLIDNYQAAGGGQFAPAHTEGGYDNVLPSGTLAFDITPELVIRASAGKTLTRAAVPQIAAGLLVPSIFNRAITQGNPNLQPEVGKSLDGSLEWYFAEGGLLSAGIFEKKLEGTPTPFNDTVTLGSTGLPDSAFDANAFGYGIGGDIPDSEPLVRTTFINQKTVKLDGLEFAYQQNFSFLPSPFDGLGAMASYTKISTQGNTFVTTEGRSISVPLVPEDSYSATAYYEKGPLAVRATYTYRAEAGTQNTNSGLNLNSGNDQIAFISPLGYLDATVSYKLTDSFELRLDALNITNENTYLYYEDPDQSSGNGMTRRDNSVFNGRTIAIGIRGQF